MSHTIRNRSLRREHPKTEQERKAWIRKKQATAELRNIKRRMKRGQGKPTDVTRSQELELLV